MKPPIEPNKEDCCNSGCNPCIFDVYEHQLKLYNKYLATGETTSNGQSENAISQLKYTAFILVRKVKICETHIMLTFKKLEGNNKKVKWKPGDHFLLKYSHDDKSCTRAYTPINLNTNKNEDFCIIIRIYEGGLVSNYLNNLNQEERTLWRGPYGSYNVTPNKFERIIMITHGTGIAPFISIIQHILDDEEDMTKIILYYCVKNEVTILFREDLYTFREYWNFTYKLFISYSVDGMQCKYHEPIVKHKLELGDLNELKPYSPNDQFLICGSTQFMDNFQKYFKKELVLSENILLF